MGVAACDPNGMNTANVSYTTERTATRTLERQGHNVQWMTCTSSYDRKNDNRYDDPNDNNSNNNNSNNNQYGTRANQRYDDPQGNYSSVQHVDCKGETTDGERIRIYGMVDREIDGRCVRGDLTADVGDRQVFRADVLGECDTRDDDGWRTPPAHDDGDRNDNGDDHNGDDHEHGDEPCPDVTKTVWCKSHEDECVSAHK
ncbi:hypothetical protein [Streptomyces sp. CRN 30]|uniref:hypothetical protein n=1 Tax=Streptomyces sp. CRN 30 TaxID=3075613 RepID=UPI002A81ABBE|nr:hypothetical protein [Streptomyces sp. CRN 30]